MYSKTQNSTLCDLQHTDSDYVVSIKYRPIHKVNSVVSLMVSDRYSDVNYVFPMARENTKLKLYKTSFPKQTLYELLKKGQYYDLYIVDSQNKTAKNSRLKSNFEKIDLSYYMDSSIGKMVVPYTTKKGNVSFKTLDIGVIANVEKAEFSSNGTLHLRCYALDPARTFPGVFRAKIILRDVHAGHEYKVEAVGFEKDPLDDRGYVYIDFLFDTQQLLKLENEDTKWRVYLELIYLEDQVETVKESIALSYFKKLKNTPQALVMRNEEGSKWKIYISRTKNSKSFSIDLYKYRFKQEIQRNIKEKLLMAKRHPLTKFLYKSSFQWIGILPAKKNLVMFESFMGKQYSCNPRAIYEYLKETHPHYKLYWSVDKKFLNNFEGKDLVLIKRYTVRWLFTMPRAQYWVTNSRMPLWISKPKHTVYVQTWHGTPLKNWQWIWRKSICLEHQLINTNRIL